MWKEAVRTGMVSLARDSEEVMRAAERGHPGTSMEMTSRSEDLAYVRRFGDPTARALVEGNARGPAQQRRSRDKDDMECLEGHYFTSVG